MNIAQLNLIAAVGRSGHIGNAGERPMFQDREQAETFSVRFQQLCMGGTVILGGRTYRQLCEVGWRRDAAPFSTFIWDREAQRVMDPEDAVRELVDMGDPVFIGGGRYTFECFMPWVEQMFITRVALTPGPEPLYMPELFGRTQ